MYHTIDFDRHITDVQMYRHSLCQYPWVAYKHTLKFQNENDA
jgi:hypothetical protein